MWININQLNKRILKRRLPVDTKFSDKWSSPKSNDFTINLPTKLSKVASMHLTSIEFPIAFYNISKCYGNNQFTIVIHETATPATVTEVLTMEDGNYSATELVSHINTLLIALGGFYNTIKCSYDPNSGHVTFDTSDAAITSIELYFNLNSAGEEYTSTSITMRAGYVFGFKNSSYTGLKTYTSEGILNASPINYVYLAIEDFNQNVNNNFISAMSDTVSSSDIIARITVGDNYFGVINETNKSIITEPREYFGPVDISRLRIRVYDEYGRILDMNNADFSCCLTIKQVYNL